MDPLESWDEIAAQLVTWRRDAGSPSYAELARRVGDQRAQRGQTAERPGKVTIYDCFRPGRRRMDLVLLGDLAAALGVEVRAVKEFEAACFSVANRVEASRVVSVSEAVVARPIVGREAELKTLLSGPGVYLVDGMPGVGKTALAREAGRALAARGDVDRVLIADLRGYDPDRPPADPEALVVAVMRELGEPPGTAAHQLGELLAKHRAALILDDAATATQVSEIVPEAASTPVLVTSRSRLTVPGAIEVSLSGLTGGEAVGLLAHHLAPSTVDAERESAEAIVTEVDGLPLALELLASQIASRSSWSIADHHRALIERRQRLRLDDRLDGALELSYRCLSAPARLLLRRFAGQPCRTLDGPALGVLGEAGDAAAAITELVAGNSVIDRDGRFELHALVRIHAAAASLDEDRPADRESALSRLFDHQVRATWAAVRTAGVDPGIEPTVEIKPDASGRSWPDARAATDWLNAELENILTVTDPQHSAARPTIALELAEATSRLFEASGHHGDALILRERALAVARAMADGRGQARAHLMLGQTLIRTAESDQAREQFEAAIAHGAATGRFDVHSSAYNCLAILAFRSGDMRGARPHLEAALRFLPDDGPPAARPVIIGNLAVISFELRDYPAALRYNELALAGAREVGDLNQIATSLCNVAEVQLAMGDLGTARTSADEAVVLAIEAANLHTEASSRSNLGLILTATGDLTGAIGEFHHALDRIREFGDPHAEADIMNNLGNAHLAAQEHSEAVGAFEEAGRLGAKVGDPVQVARHHVGLGQLAKASGDITLAREEWTAAVNYYDEASDPRAASVREWLDDLGAGD